MNEKYRYDSVRALLNNPNAQRWMRRLLNRSVEVEKPAELPSPGDIAEYLALTHEEPLGDMVDEEIKKRTEGGPLH